jgi:hypothetical protein
LTAENGNGELRQLLEIKRGYRQDLISLEEELRTKYERDLADGRKHLKEQYLENVVDTIFAETPPTPESGPKPAPAEGVRPIAGYEPETVPASEKPPRCPECNTPVDPTDKFCAECAYPLQEDLKENAPVVTTGRKFGTRVRR